MAWGPRAGGSDEWAARGTTDGSGVWGVFGGRAAPLAGDVCGWRREVTLSSPLEEREGGQRTNCHGYHRAPRKGTTPVARTALRLRGRCVRRYMPTAVDTT
jgi:hypothetical protein